VNSYNPQRAVFLDRDGVIVDDPGYLSDPEALRLLPRVAEALIALRQSGWLLILVSNQSGIARGYFTEQRLAEIHARLREVLAVQGASLDAIYYCPHHPEGTVAGFARECECRKPQPGLLVAAARDLDLDLPQCWMVGDQLKDVAAGQAAGCRTVLISDGEPEGGGPSPDYRAASLLDAAEIVLHFTRGANTTRGR
jgi:D-glycero-D-manno-heptose 1,7-bisphosphate phosphatase